ncbi:MAG: hypothetical protein Q9222_003780 [Ikaeria aurantiellina]
MALSVEQPPNADVSLHELLWKRYRKNENYLGESFICFETVRRLLSYKRIAHWIEEHPLHLHSPHTHDDTELICIILNRSPLCFAMLVLGRLEHFFAKLTYHGLNDTTLFRSDDFHEACTSAGLTPRESDNVAECRKKIGAVLRKNEHEAFPRGTVLPYRNINHPKDDRLGGFGIVQRVEVAPGHLKGCKEKTVALKRLRPLDNNDTEEWGRFYREVETLQRKRHPNIVPLLASYFLDGTDSSDNPMRTLCLLFPWADMDLDMWMNSDQTPPPIQGYSLSERRGYIYRSILALVSGLSYLHRDDNGLFTSHHDLKPNNVLIIGQDFKIADLGRSHLRPVDGGSETEGANGLGTYEYQPPEYWQDNGSRAKIKHGRAFDMWAIGCIIIELATLIVHGWELEMVSNFRQRRAANTAADRPKVAETRASRKESDSSFHNNWSIVSEWVDQLRQHPRGSRMLEEILDVAMAMLVHEPGSRIYSWEAEIDLYEIQHPGLLQQGCRNDGSLSVQPPWRGQYHEIVLNGRETPLHRAAAKEDRKRMTALLNLGWRMFIQDQNGKTVLDIVKRSRNNLLRESFGKFLGQGVTSTNTPQGIILLKAAEAGDAANIQILLENGLSPMLVDTTGQSSLALAVANGHLTAIDTLLQSDSEEQLLLKDRLDGSTAIHQAVGFKRIDVLKHLLSHAPDLEDRQREGKTALFLAAEKGLTSSVKVLLDHVPSAQVFTQSTTGDTPVHKAVNLDNDILQLLLTTDDSTRCLEHRNQHGETPLWLAVRHQRFEAFKTLQDRGASLRVANNDHDNLLHLVARQRLYDFLNENLMAFDASNIEDRNRWNDTPLTIADRNGYAEVAGLLRKHYFGKMINVADALGSIDIPSKNSKLFYTLGFEGKWIRPDTKGYWRHLTYESYRVYDGICALAATDGGDRVRFTDFVKQFNPHDPRPETIEYVWRRLLKLPDSDVRRTSQSRSFVQAILYMLHIERFSSERPRGDNNQPGEIKAKRRQILKRWNFAGDLGIYRSIPMSKPKAIEKCRIVQVVEDYKKRGIFGTPPVKQHSDYELWGSLLSEWKKG